MKQFCHICIVKGETNEATITGAFEELIDDKPTGRILYSFSCAAGHIWTDVGLVPPKDV